MRKLADDKLGPYKDMLEEYSRLGWVVTPLEDTLKSGDVKEIKDRFEEFERDMKSLTVLREALMDLEAQGFENDVRAIEGKLRNISKIVEIEDDILKLQLKIERRKRAERRREEEERRERSIYGQKIEQWKNKGFNTKRLENVLDSDISAREMALKSFERDINEIDKLKDMLNELSGRGFDDDLDALKEHLMDPDMVFENEEELLRIKLRVDRKEKHKAVRQEAESMMRGRFQQILDDWKVKGFNVSGLASIMDKDIDFIADKFERAKLDIGKLSVLKEEFEELNTQNHEEEAKEIEAMLVDLGKVQEAEDAILDLQLRIERKKKEGRRKREVEDRMREELKEKIVNWRSEGFVTDYLYSMLNGDLAILKESVEDFEAAAKKLKELEDELRSMDTSGYEDVMEDIVSKCRDVRLTDEVENDILNLLVRSRRERREKMRMVQIKDTLERWKKEGYVVDKVEALLSETDLKILEREFVTHKIGIHTLKELEKDLDSLASEDFEEDVETIKKLMKNIESIPTVEDMIFDLQRRIEENLEKARNQKLLESKEKHFYVEKLSEWVSEGFREGIIERLEQVISRDQDMDTVRSAFKTFESEVARVMELREVLDTLDAKGFDAEINDLRNRLTNIDEVGSVESDMMSLLNKIERRTQEEERKRIEDTQKRGEFLEQLKKWEDEGYHVEQLRTSIEKDNLVNLRRNFVVFRIRIQKIRELSKQLDAIRDPNFEENKEKVLHLLKDVDNLDKAEEEMNALAAFIEKSKEEKAKRAEFESKMNEWGEQGYNIERLERALKNVDLDFISKEFLVFKIRMQKLEDLREELNILILSAKDFMPEADKIRAYLKDVDQITTIREMISTLKANIDEKREELKRKDEDERRLRLEFESKLTNWATQGFNIEELARILEGPMDVVKTSFEDFERDLGKVTRLKEELDALDTEGYEGEVDLIKSKLLDVKKVVEAEEDLALLKERIRRTSITDQQILAEDERSRREFEEKMTAWKEQGYNVIELEKLLDKDLGELRKAFVIFRIRVERLKELEEDLKNMDLEGLEERTQDIMKDMRDVNKIGPVMNKISELQIMIGDRRSKERQRREAERKEREALAEKMVLWISEGYNVAPLESVINEGMDIIRNRFSHFEAGVNKLKEIEPEFEALEINGHAREAKKLRSMMMDVEKVNQIIDRINTIRGKVIVEPIVVDDAPKMEVPKIDAGDDDKDQDPNGSGSMLSSIRERLGALKLDDLGKVEDENGHSETTESAKDSGPDAENKRVKFKKKVKKVKKKKKKKAMKKIRMKR